MFADSLNNIRSNRYSVLNIPGAAHFVKMITKVRYAFLRVFFLVWFHFRCGGLLQFPQNPRRRVMLVLEIMTLFIRPLLTFLLAPANRQSSRPRTPAAANRPSLLNVSGGQHPFLRRTATTAST
jgi:hypothetical protein